jgi:hypothetical protein
VEPWTPGDLVSRGAVEPWTQDVRVEPWTQDGWGLGESSSACRRSSEQAAPQRSSRAGGGPADGGAGMQPAGDRGPRRKARSHSHGAAAGERRKRK